MKLKQTGPLAPADKPWQLIRDAIADLKLQEKCKSVVIDMDVWHEFDEYEGRCHQCLAGLEMSRRLGVDTESVVHFPDVFEEEADRLWALNKFRSGEVGVAYEHLGITRPPGVSWRTRITPCHINPTLFKRQMLELADTLEAAHKNIPAA